MAVGRTAMQVEPPSGGGVDKILLGDLVNRSSISGIPTRRDEIGNPDGVGVHGMAIIRPHKTDAPDQIRDLNKRAQGTAANRQYRMDLGAIGNAALGGFA